MKLDLYLTPYTKINFKSINNLNMRTKTILEENKQVNLDLIFSFRFLDMTLKAQAAKEKIRQIGLHQN